MANKPEYSNDFIIVRRAVVQNLVAAKAVEEDWIKEENLTPHQVYMLIYEVGKYFADNNIAGLTEIPESEKLE